MKQAWLQCRQIRPGMFSDERIVTVTTTRGEDTSYFVPADTVQGDRVLVDLEEYRGVHWATLPTDHPYHPIPVRPEELQLRGSNGRSGLRA